MLSKAPYKGTRDFFPKDKRILDYLFDKMKKSAESFGYESYDGPLLEEVALYKAKSGEELINEQIYDFEDRGKRHVAIRPEMTPTLARMVANIHREASKPIRWYAIPNLMRYERPQKGRLREHWQFNCDIFGAPGRMGEVEILMLAIHLMKSFGATEKHFEILVNDRQIIDCLFSKMLQLNPEQSYKLIKIVDRSKKISAEDLQKSSLEILNQPQFSIFQKYLSLNSFEQLNAFLKENGQVATAEQFDQFLQPIKKLQLQNYIKYDPTIARGLDYYTGIVFEIFDKNPENRRAICGGGAYADLLKIFNEPSLPGVGFGLGDVTLKDFLTVHQLLPPNIELPKNDLYLATDRESEVSTLFTLANDLRLKGLRVVCGLEAMKFNKIFSHAEKIGAKYVGLIGESESQSKTIQLKNMATRQQVQVGQGDLFNYDFLT